MSVDAKFIRDIDPYFQYPTDENPTTQQEYQEAVRNWVTTEEAIVDSHLWQPTTNYNVGNQIKTPSLPSQCVLVCTTAGTSGNSEPDYTNVSVGSSVTDGTVTWSVSEAIVGNDYIKTHANGISTDKTFLNFYLNTSNPENAIESMQLNSGSLNIGGKALNNASNVFLNGTGNIFGYKTSGAFTLFCGSDNINPSMTFWGVQSSSNAGYFRLRATLNGNNNKDLVGRPNGELTWNNKNVLTDATVGNYTSKDIENAINLSAGTARNITNVSLSAGRWLVIGAAKFGDVTASKIYGIQLGTTSGAYYYANSGSVAAQSAHTGPLSLQTVHIFNLSATTTIYLTGYATAACSVDNAAVQAIRIV